MSKIAVATKRFSGFMKRNAMYLLILLCIASVATVIALAVTGNFGEESIDLTPNEDINVPVDNTPTDNKPNNNQTNKPCGNTESGIACLSDRVGLYHRSHKAKRKHGCNCKENRMLTYDS